MLAEQVLLVLGAGVETDLAQGDHPLVLEELGQLRQALLGVGPVHAEEGHREAGEELEAERLGRGGLHAEEALPEELHGVGVRLAEEHVRAGDHGGLHAHHDQLLQLLVLDHVGMQMGVDETHDQIISLCSSTTAMASISTRQRGSVASRCTWTVVDVGL